MITFENFMDIEIVPELTVRFQRATFTFLIEFRICHSSKYWVDDSERAHSSLSLLIQWVLSKNLEVLYTN